MGSPIYVVMAPPRKKYRFRTFIWDMFWIIMTHGLWILWIFIREMRRR